MEEKRSKSKKFRNDIVLAATVLLLAAAAMLFWYFGRNDGDCVSVLLDGAEIARYPLAEDTVVAIASGEGTGENTLVIEDGKASVSDANCPDGICVQHRAISQVGETIVCLPHKLVIKIIQSADKQGLDMAA